MLHEDLSFFDTLPDSALIREKLIIEPLHKSRDKRAATAAPRIVPVSRSTWRRMVKAGHAPAPIKLHTGISAWRVSDLREWLASQNHNYENGNSK